jgi:hypothetical protein
MARLSMEDDEKICAAAVAEVRKIDPQLDATNRYHVSIVKRAGRSLVVVVWLRRPQVSEDVLGEQYNYHVVLRIVYHDKKRWLRKIEIHQSEGNTWVGEFRCGSCDWAMQQGEGGQG